MSSKPYIFAFILSAIFFGEACIMSFSQIIETEILTEQNEGKEESETKYSKVLIVSGWNDPLHALKDYCSANTVFLYSFGYYKAIDIPPEHI